VIVQCSWREVVGVFGGFVKEEELGWEGLGGCYVDSHQCSMVMCMCSL
jgi:hypothetical protein